MVIVIGEILMDIVNGDNIVYHPGGAPLNCATFLKKLGDEVGFYGVVGDDDLGKELIAFAKKQNFDYLRIDQIPNKKTTYSEVTFSENKERHFFFHREDKVDQCLDFDAIDEIVDKANHIHVGSFLLSEENGRKFLKQLLIKAHKKGIKVSFDVNYRAQIFNSVLDAKRIYHKFLKQFDLIKYSGDEDFILENQIEKNIYYLRSDGKNLVQLSIGDKLLTSRNPLKLSSVVDTTGAGDALMGSYLHTFVNAKNISDYESIDEAVLISSLSTAYPGGAESFPNKNLINFFERLINKKGSINNIYEIKVSGSDCQIISFDLINQKVLIRFSDNKEKSINLEKIDF